MIYETQINNSPCGHIGISVCCVSVASWLTLSHDFGAFSENLGSVDAEFRLVNIGDEPLTILNARANCGCTVPKFTEGAIAPGDTAILSVSYLASGRPGRFSKKIYVNTSDNPSKQQVLTISGTVIGASHTIRSRFPISAGPLQLRDTVVGFSEVPKGKIKTVYLQGYNLTEKPVRPSVTGLPDYLKVIVAPETVPPGEQVSLAFTLDSNRMTEWGITTADFSLIPDTDADTVGLSMFTIVSEDFSQLTPGQRMNAPEISLDTQKIDLGTISADKPVSVSFNITNKGKLPLIIRRIQAVDPAITKIELSSDKIKKGKSARLKLIFDPLKTGTEIINSRISITANDPANPLTVIRVTAELMRD